MVGYHGVSARSRNQRQSGECWTSSHTGLPSAPAKCATAVSADMTKSISAMTEAVSRKSLSNKSEWTTCDRDCKQDWSRCGTDVCRLQKTTPGTCKIGKSD